MVSESERRIRGRFWVVYRDLVSNAMIGTAWNSAEWLRQIGRGESSYTSISNCVYMHCSPGKYHKIQAILKSPFDTASIRLEK